MIVRKKFVVPGLEEISSDEDSDYDTKGLDNISRKITNYETILIDDSLSEDDDIIFVSLDDKKKHLNDVWRNIIECDLLDQRVKNLGLRKFRVNRDIESYEIPSCKIRNFKRTKVNRFSKKPHILKRLQNIIHISSSDDESEYDYKDTKVKNIQKYRIGKEEPIVIIDDDDDDDDKSTIELSDTDSDSNEQDKPNTWNKLIKHLEHDQTQIEFDGSRETVARRIANELKETKIDLIDRCLIYLGLEKCQKFVTATKKIEENGGMPTKDCTRRRTPGGVFLTLIKSDRTIEQALKEQIFLDNDEPNNENESLWWKSVEINQYHRKQRRNSVNYSRRKEFKTYTLIDLDYFQCIKDFRYRYIPMMSNFPVNVDNDKDCNDNLDNYDVMEIDIGDNDYNEDNNTDDNDEEVICMDDKEKDGKSNEILNPNNYCQMDIFEIGNN